MLKTRRNIYFEYFLVSDVFITARKINSKSYPMRNNKFLNQKLVIEYKVKKIVELIDFTWLT